MLDRLSPGTLVIVPSDREDTILTLVRAYLADHSQAAVPAHVEALVERTPGAVQAGSKGVALGILLTGGYELKPEVLDAVRDAGMFAAIVDDDTYSVASKVLGLLVKVHAADTAKIELIKELVWEHLLMDRFLEAATEPRFDWS